MPTQLSANALQLLKKRYLNDGESPDTMWDRVSGGNAEYRAMMADLWMLPNSPTLFNAGVATGGTLSACFVFDIADTLLGDWPEDGLTQPFSDSILGTMFKAACVAKAGGGVGYYLGNIRPEGSLVNSTHKHACGPVAVVHMLNRLRTIITQGGKRDLAQMGVLPAAHKDALKFIHCKDEDPQALSSFNLSLSWTDEWLASIDDHETASEVWQEQCHSAWKTGCPGVLFWDVINRCNPTPHLGDINATNPCGETPNISDEPCNLGSLNLRKFVYEGVVMWGDLEHYARLATRFLDDVLDRNTFPHPDITRMANATRKLGLGVMGWADMLALTRIPYDSQDALDLASSVMSVVTTAAHDESVRMGKEKGLYPAYGTGKQPTWVKPTRNATNTSIAPTGSISIIANCEPSIEPHYALKRTRTTYDGMKIEEDIHDWLGDLGGFVPKTAHEIAPEWHVKHQAVFQKHTDLGVSKTVNLPNSATPTVVSRIYKMMWEEGCKGGTIFRDGCRSEQVLVAKKTSVFTVERVVELPADVPQLPRHKFKVGGVTCYLHVGTQDGRPVEVFLRSKGIGTTIQGMLDAWAMGVSLSLQRGVTVDELVRLHAGSRFEPAGLTGNPELPVCTSIPDYVVRYLVAKFNGKDAPTGSGMLCPECGKELIRQAGCLSCKSCTFTRCG